MSRGWGPAGPTAVRCTYIKLERLTPVFLFGQDRINGLVKIRHKNPSCTICGQNYKQSKQSKMKDQNMFSLFIFY